MLQSTQIISLTRRIRLTRQEVTILFTDIADSTRYWGNRGDLDGRLMVDRHNRILLPIVRRFRGKVIKTMGDGLMAMFKRPAQALLAAIAIQQALERERKADREFRIHVRMGLHIGEALVERGDVYGDVVNVAARIEGEAEGDEILLSGRLARRLDKETFRRSKKGSFLPKGKHRRMALYRCHWQEHENLLRRVKHSWLPPLHLGQRLELLAYLLLLFGGLYYVYQQILRYLLFDNETIALLLLNPLTMLWRYGYLTLPGALLAAGLLWRCRHIKVISTRALKALKGGAAAALVIMCMHSLTGLIQSGISPGVDRALYTSHHLFVEILEDHTAIRVTPDLNATILRYQDAGDLLLLSDVRRVDMTVWNRVLVDEEEYGWVERRQAPAIGVAEKRISLADKYTLTYLDLLTLLLALPAAMWGYRSFHLHPI